MAGAKDENADAGGEVEEEEDDKAYEDIKSQLEKNGKNLY